jgi:hypothetical protein
MSGTEQKSPWRRCRIGLPSADAGRLGARRNRSGVVTCVERNNGRPCMNVIDPGRSYELSAGIMLHFVRKEGGRNTSNGTTNEELLEMLIHRVTDAYQRVPCRETVHALYLLNEALMAFRLRTRRRISANVEGTNRSHDSEAECERFARLESVIRAERNELRVPWAGLAESRSA